MAEYKAAAEALYSLFAGLPERMRSRNVGYRGQLPRLHREINGYFRWATERLQADTGALAEVIDEVDDARYPNWSRVPAEARSKHAQLVALFEDPERFVPPVVLKSGARVFERLLSHAQAMFHRMGLLLDGNAQALHHATEQLQEVVTVDIEEPELDEIVETVAVTYLGVTDNLGINPGALEAIADQSGVREPWTEVPKSTRDQVARIRALCMDPRRFVPECNLDQVEQTFGWASKRWQALVGRLDHAEA